eukprot:928095-Rhodomonas_salina.1
MGARGGECAREIEREERTRWSEKSVRKEMERRWSGADGAEKKEEQKELDVEKGWSKSSES